MRFLLTALTGFATTQSAFAQGTIRFSNWVPGVVDAPITAPYWGGHFRTPIDDRFVAQLFAAPPWGQLQPIGDPVPFAEATLGQDGYFDGGERVIPGVPAGEPVQWKVVYWYGNLGATYADAVNKYQAGFGATPALTLPRLGGGTNPPAPLSGLHRSAVSATLGFDPVPQSIRTSGIPFPSEDSLVTRSFDFFPTIEWVMGLALSGSSAFVAGGYAGLITFDLSDPWRPVRTSELPLDYSMVRAVVLRGSRAYLAVANWNGDPPFSGLRVIDVSRPSRPMAGSALGLPGEPQCLAISTDGRLALVGAGKGGLIVVAMGSPDAPSVAGTYPTDWPTVAVGFLGNLGLAAAGSAGLHCVDLTGPFLPRRLGVYDAGEPVVAVAVRGSLAIAGGRDAGLHVVDLSDPTQPRRVGYLAMRGCTGGLLLDGDLLYVGGSYDPGLKAATLTVVDLSDPSTPKRVSQSTVSEHAVGFAIQRGRLWVADWVGLTGFPLGPVLQVEPNLSVSLFGTQGQLYEIQELNPHVPAATWQAVSQVVGAKAPRNIGSLPGPGGASRLLRAVPKS